MTGILGGGQFQRILTFQLFHILYNECWMSVDTKYVYCNTILMICIIYLKYTSITIGLMTINIMLRHQVFRIVGDSALGQWNAWGASSMIGVIPTISSPGRTRDKHTSCNPRIMDDVFFRSHQPPPTFQAIYVNCNSKGNWLQHIHLSFR